ncbi:MAG: hypothetical protein K0S12_248 [Bacteroidetes bacterium]|jgi:hypothetical protein|nr:hypothetical protein [Bacteroidota bacterium]
MHIVFWLVKDSCWMMEFKTLGAIMIIPTVFLAVYLVYKTVGTRDFYINMAIFFWISANSFWMLMEFFNDNHLRYYASIPFALGFVFVVLFYVTAGKKREIHHID